MRNFPAKEKFAFREWNDRREKKAQSTRIKSVFVILVSFGGRGVGSSDCCAHCINRLIHIGVCEHFQLCFWNLGMVFMLSFAVWKKNYAVNFDSLPFMPWPNSTSKYCHYTIGSWYTVSGCSFFIVVVVSLCSSAATRQQCLTNNNKKCMCGNRQRKRTKFQLFNLNFFRWHWWLCDSVCCELAEWNGENPSLFRSKASGFRPLGADSRRQCKKNGARFLGGCLFLSWHRFMFLLYKALHNHTSFNSKIPKFSIRILVWWESSKLLTLF